MVLHLPDLKGLTRQDTAALRRGLMQPDVRAFAIVVGRLNQLPTDRSRARVMNYVADKIRETWGTNK